MLCCCCCFELELLRAAVLFRSLLVKSRKRLARDVLYTHSALFSSSVVVVVVVLLLLLFHSCLYGP